MTWQAIKTAPKDETTVDLWLVGSPFKNKPELQTGFRVPDCWYCPEEKSWLRADGYGEIEKVKGRGIKITHWMPRPAPPEAPNA
jgi:hypothetical protein